MMLVTLIIIINLCHYFHIYPRLSGWGTSTITCCLYHVYPGKAGFCLCINHRLYYGPTAVFVYLLYSVSKITYILSSIYHAMYGAVCIQPTRLSCDNCKNTCTLSLNHQQIGSMNRLPLFMARTWNNGMCGISLYVLYAHLLINISHSTTKSGFRPLWSDVYRKFLQAPIHFSNVVIKFKTGFRKISNKYIELKNGISLVPVAFH